MRYRLLSATCKCGRPAHRIREIGLTSDRQLLLQWRCLACKTIVEALKPLSECWKECPGYTAPDGTFHYSGDDRRFLTAIGVKPPEEEAPRDSAPSL